MNLQHRVGLETSHCHLSEPLSTQFLMKPPLRTLNGKKDKDYSVYSMGEQYL